MSVNIHMVATFVPAQEPIVQLNGKLVQPQGWCECNVKEKNSFPVRDRSSIIEPMVCHNTNSSVLVLRN
jgi:hypothetical protein